MKYENGLELENMYKMNTGLKSMNRAKAFEEALQTPDLRRMYQYYLQFFKGIFYYKMGQYWQSPCLFHICPCSKSRFIRIVCPIINAVILKKWVQIEREINGQIQ